MNDLNPQPALPNETPLVAKAAPEGKRRAADRLNIPPSVVRASGFAPGDSAYVLDADPAAGASKPVLVLVKQQPEKPLGTYRVSTDWRIRVTPAMLKKAGMEGEHFEMNGGDGKIVVRPQSPAPTPQEAVTKPDSSGPFSTPE